MDANPDELPFARLGLFLGFLLGLPGFLFDLLSLSLFSGVVIVRFTFLGGSFSLCWHTLSMTGEMVLTLAQGPLQKHCPFF